MKFIPEWLKTLFRVDEIWVDQGQGRWRRQRRLHPVTRIVLLTLLLISGITWSVNRFFPEKTPPVIEAGDPRPEARIREPRLIDFVPTSLDMPPLDDFAPSPIPAALNIGAEEYWVRINKENYKLYLYRGEMIDRTFKIAVGRNPGDKQRSGDNRTPTGIFSVQSIEDSRAWTHDFRDGKGVIRGAYGPWFIRLRTGWKGIGIHGTHAPDSIGTMVSEGCIRMQNEELEELKQFAFKDMKVMIEE